MKNENRLHLINALIKLQDAFKQVDATIDEFENSADTDAILETFKTAYPFANSFDDITLNVRNWSNEVIEELRKEIYFNDLKNH